jgi:CyaY protein
MGLNEQKTPILTEGIHMEEAEFNALADEELARIEAALEAALEEGSAEFDIDAREGTILELEFEDGSKMVINRHSAAREIWVAARSGGFHFHLQGEQWLATRDGIELYTALSRLVSEHAGVAVEIRPAA